jgi:hypothetical protein
MSFNHNAVKVRTNVRAGMEAPSLSKTSTPPPAAEQKTMMAGM